MPAMPCESLLRQQPENTVWGWHVCHFIGGPHVLPMRARLRVEGHWAVQQVSSEYFQVNEWQWPLSAVPTWAAEHRWRNHMWGLPPWDCSDLISDRKILCQLPSRVLWPWR